MTVQTPEKSKLPAVILCILPLCACAVFGAGKYMASSLAVGKKPLRGKKTLADAPLAGVTVNAEELLAFLPVTLVADGQFVMGVSPLKR